VRDVSSGTKPVSVTSLSPWFRSKLMRSMGRLIILGALCGSCLLLRPGLDGQTTNSGGMEMATKDRMEQPGWWPTKGDRPRSSFAGTEKCAQCHANVVQSQAATPMAGAGYRASDAEILTRDTPLAYARAPYRYGISRTESGVAYSVTDGGQGAAVPLEWAFGMGAVGQTYLYEQNGHWHESDLSFFSNLAKLDITVGHSHLTPRNVDEALGSAMTENEAQNCFGCHTTASTVERRFEPQNAVPGITCEGCHGPGADHAARELSGTAQRLGEGIVNPADLSPENSVDYCGACHRSYWDLVLSGLKNLGTKVVRFQPYRLEESRCWGKAGDERVTCIACHDPHQPLERNLAAYDKRCLSCHVNRGEARSRNKPGVACPKSANNCASCHMPKVAVPDTYAEFTDHFIRVVRDGKGFPE
jgi:Cytochrome c554 and c-prime